MRLKTASKYIFSEMSYPILIFYGIITFLFIFFSVSFSSGHSSGNGIEMMSAIFLFIVGLNAFKKNYLFLMSNGVSRNTQFKGFLLTIIPVTAGMTILDMILGTIFSRVMDYTSMFDQVYERTAQSPGSVITSFLWSMSLLLFAISLGYLITTSFYRMHKMVKLVVAIGVPVFLTIVLPYITFRFTSIKTVNWVYNAIRTLFGVAGELRPMNAVATFIVLTIIFSTCSYLLIRRAPVKEN